MWTSLAISPSSSLVTGMPVHDGHDLGDVVGVDLLLEQAARTVEGGDRGLLARGAAPGARSACRT